MIERYREPYKIEQTLRISKSDLYTKPIFHFKEQSIKLYKLFCFMALGVSKLIEFPGYIATINISSKYLPFFITGVMRILIRPGASESAPSQMARAGNLHKSFCTGMI